MKLLTIMNYCQFFAHFEEESCKIFEDKQKDNEAHLSVCKAHIANKK